MATRCYRFGRFELDPPRFELRHGDAPVPLQPKALRLLLYLVAERDRVVTKDELLTELWPDAVVTEASLSKAVSAVRRVLARGGGDGARIQTVWGLGFRFVAPAIGSDDASGTPAALLRERRETPHDPTFVGRADVLGLVDEACRAAAGGRGRLIFLSGEAGMGKTRTAQEAVACARAAGTAVVSGWCLESGETPELWPWLQVARQLFGRADASQLVTGLDDAIADLAAILPAARGLVRGAPGGGRIEAPHARFRLLDTLAELLLRAARREPHLVVLDDLHWADRGSLTLLAHVAHDVPTSGLVLLAAHRSDEIGATHPLFDLTRTPGATVHALAGLDRGEVARLVEIETGVPIGDALAESIRARTGGNPFFVKEIARAEVARGAAEVGDAGAVPGGASLSPGIRHVLTRRLDRLSAPARDLLTLAALIGADIDLALTARAARCSPRAALSLLEEARATVLVEERDGCWRFPHALVREALIETPSTEQRARLHRSVAAALAAHHAADLDPHVGDLARHLCAGAASGGAAEAVAIARRAGDRARGLLAYGEAAEHYGRALAALAFVQPTDERLRCELLLALGEAQMVAGRPEEGRRALGSAADAARRLGLSEDLARAALASGGIELSTEVGIYDPAVVDELEEALRLLPETPSALRVRLLVRLAIALFWSSDPGRSPDLIARAVAMARRLDDPVALGYALYSRHWSSLGPPDLDAQRAGATEMLAAARGAGHRELELAAHSCRFLASVERGDIAEAEATLCVYERLAEQLRVPRYRWRAFFYRTNLVLLEGRFAEAEARAEQTIADEDRFAPGDAGLVGTTQLLTIYREQGRLDAVEPIIARFAARFPRAAAWRATRALALAEASRHDEARSEIDGFVGGDFAAIPVNYNRLSGLVLLADASALVGHVPAARRLYALLVPYLPRTVVLGAGVACWGALDLFLGRLAAIAGRPAEAMRHLEAALAANTRIGARPWAAWAEYELARVYGSRSGRSGRARAHLARARALAAGLGMRRLTERVEAAG